jgi:glycosyltransferase involved in cell wall biosynthesis
MQQNDKGYLMGSVVKYLVIGEAFYPEDFLINDLVKEWEQEGHQIEVLTRAPSYPAGKVFPGYKNKLYQKEKWGNILIRRFPVIPGYHKSTVVKVLNYLSFVFFGSMIALFIAKRYKRIFIYHTGPLSLAIPGILIKKISKAPVTIWSFDLWPATVYAYGFKKTKLLSWFLDGLVKWIYRNCENIIVSSQGFVPELKKYVIDKTIHFAPNWPQTENIVNKKSSITLEAGKVHFTFTGNVGKVQNLENVIKGFHEAALQNTQLNIFGDGSHLEYLKTMVADAKIDDVIFHGRIPLSEISDILAQSDVLLISLIPDPVMELTLPLKFQTYLRAAKPVYAVMSGEVNRIVSEFQLGEVADPQNLDEITNGFKRFDLSQKRKDEIKSQCEFLINTVYNRKKIIQSITGIFFT